MPELRAMTTADLFAVLFPAVIAGLALTTACAGSEGDGDSIIQDSDSSDDTGDDDPDTESESSGDDDDSDADTDTDTGTDTQPAYPGGHYQFVEANPLRENFLETFRIGDFAGKHAFWFVFCPM